MDSTQIILKPLVTEKGTWEAQARNRYSFKVHPKANKSQVRHAVQSLYKVRVLGVSTQVRPGKSRRTRYGEVNTGTWKRATVQLHQDDKIEFF